MKCEDCKFYDKLTDERGACFRYPPQAKSGDIGIFPQVRSKSNCGEFAEKEKK